MGRTGELEWDEDLGELVLQERTGAFDTYTWSGWDGRKG